MHTSSNHRRTRRIATAGLILVSALLCSCESSDLQLPAIPTDTYVYVHPDGIETARGSADDPLPDLQAALALAADTGCRGVKVAAGDFSGDFDLPGGLDIIGGCDPDTWEPQPGVTSRIQLLASPVRGLDIELPTVVTGLEIVAADGRIYTARINSIALHLDGCTDALRFEGCRFSAGQGLSLEPVNIDGVERCCAVPGHPGGTVTCLDVVGGVGGLASGWFHWGTGGDGGIPGAAGEDGVSGCPDLDDGCAPGGLGGAPGLDGQDGQHGSAGTPGANGEPAVAWGVFAAGDFVALRSTGGDFGRAGNLGSGGGGGGGSPTAAGGGGGAGGNVGDGGDYGKGGYAGGHSVGVICRNSDAVFRNCRLDGGTGGNGSRGGNGATGLEGGTGGDGGNACPGAGRGGRGGNGGHGGGGGGGGGGNGGCSFALLLTGERVPDVDESCILTWGEPGLGGSGGRHGDDLPAAADGRDGLAGGLHILPYPDGP